MKFSVFILALMILPACGGFKLFKDSQFKGRSTASVATHIPAPDYKAELNELHGYYLIAQKNRAAVDSKLIVIDSKIDELESLLLKKNSHSLKEAVSEFAKSSDVASLSMKNLSRKLGLKTPTYPEQISQKSVEDAIKLAEDTKEFQILSMNIEHLSHMMNLKLKNTQPRKTSLDWMAQHPDKIIKRTKKLI